MRENGSFDIMSFCCSSSKKKSRCRCWLSAAAAAIATPIVTTIQLPTKLFAHITSVKLSHSVEPHVCWLSLGYLNSFYRLCTQFEAHHSFFSRAFWSQSSSTMLISFHINDFCYFVSGWQYAMYYIKQQAKKGELKTVTSCSIEWHTHTRYRQRGKRLGMLLYEYKMQKKSPGQQREKSLFELHFMCTIRIYIFHEFVLEHALGNRINVYCPSQSCRHQTSKWRNWASAKKTTPGNVTTRQQNGQKKSNNNNNDDDDDEREYRIINETYHVDP